MKLLMCIGGVEPSVETLRFGARIARALEADVSVLYVQPKVPLSVREEITLAREKLSEWEIELPGVRVLRAARDQLVREGLIKTTSTGEIAQRHALKPGIRGAYELHVYGIHGENIRLRLREGDIVREIKREVESDNLDLVLFGAGRERRILHKLIQFVNCSILVAKNPRDVEYEFLICTDSSEASRKAEQFGIRLASFLKSPVLLMSVAKNRSREHVAMEGAERASKLLVKAGIKHSISVRLGDVVEEIAARANEDSLVIMGASRTSELKKLLFGSKPTKVVERVPCPVLIVK
jgi:nucleotide-binding universal stress UspA family protein